MERWRAEARLDEKWTVALPSEAEWEKAARGGTEILAKPVICTVDNVVASRGFPLQDNPLLKCRYP